MPDFDTLIAGGLVVDGSRVPAYRADVGIKDGRIAKIGRLKRASAKRVLDASGLIVARARSTCTPTTTHRFTGTPTAPLTAGTV